MTAPPLVPVPLAERPSREQARPPSGRSPAWRSRAGRVIAPRLRRGAGLLWRRAWVLCFGYERVRYGVLHPESRLPGHRIPAAEAIRMANDCLSPVDLVRDFGPRR